MRIAFERPYGPPSEVMHGVAAVLVQDGMHPVLLGIVVDHHQDKGMPIR